MRSFLFSPLPVILSIFPPFFVSISAPDYDFGQRPSTAPKATQTPNASHSYRSKCPGTAGSTFIRIIIKPTAPPTTATHR